MKKAYITPNARILSLNAESTLLTGSLETNGEGTGDTGNNLSGSSTDETWGGEFDSNRRGGGLWDDM